MVRLAFMFVVIVQHVYGNPPLIPLSVKGGCSLVSTELNISRVEGEAIILFFPMFETVLREHNIALPTAKYLITKDNGPEGVAYHSEGRVQQHNKQLWFLPAQASDSGEYVCSYRNETYCVTGSIRLQVYESNAADMVKVSYPVRAVVGENLRLSCPSLSHFNKTGRRIEWHKDSSPTSPRPGRASSFSQNRGKLIIPTVRRSHAGVYTCQLRALINDQTYKVSRTIVLRVEDWEPEITEPDLSSTSDPGPISSSTANTPMIRPPVIVSPLNGSIFETSHGSALELSCTALTECQTADSTVVTWLVNYQSVESSYLDGRALQGGRRVTRVSDGCHIEMRLVVVEMTEQDVKTELKCVAQNRGGRQEVVAQLQLADSTFTWLVVAAVGVSCFLSVVSVFLYVLFRPKRKKKMDYILARQNSTF
ncbi:interleukin-1 receptor type 2 [Epinephelus moara]|uniref:interleukin-1 receptor type 2 n=1 Tax=Epinephelus moara TaxID=300413 RepID=UPI00214EA187|nr:interleukin-1 receptor type 2 [Epinephelus moara]